MPLLTFWVFVACSRKNFTFNNVEFTASVLRSLIIRTELRPEIAAARTQLIMNWIQLTATSEQYTSTYIRSVALSMVMINRHRTSEFLNAL
jgi:hypothetical protein